MARAAMLALAVRGASILRRRGRQRGFDPQAVLHGGGEYVARSAPGEKNGAGKDYGNNAFEPRKHGRSISIFAAPPGVRRSMCLQDSQVSAIRLRAGWSPGTTDAVIEFRGMP